MAAGAPGLLRSEGHVLLPHDHLLHMGPLSVLDPGGSASPNPATHRRTTQSGPHSRTAADAPHSSGPVQTVSLHSSPTTTTRDPTAPPLSSFHNTSTLAHHHTPPLHGPLLTTTILGSHLTTLILGSHLQHPTHAHTQSPTPYITDSVDCHTIRFCV